VIVPDVGGGFGPKMEGTPEEILLPWLAKQLGRPVRFVETRTENMTAMGHGRDQIQYLAIGGSRDGTVQAYRIEVLGNAGAYCMLGGFLPFFTHVMASGVYDIAKIETAAKGIVTNTTPVVAYRGAGRPEATAAIERAMDLFAAEIGMDPVDVRRKNLIKSDAFPATTAVGTVYDTAITSALSTWCSRPPTTAPCGPSRRPGASAATSSNSGSASRSMSRSRRVPLRGARSGARSRSTAMAAPRSIRARCRTARAMPPRSRCW
jgi:CO/xanthine dehydrogenase Mo-binding subunit